MYRTADLFTGMFLLTDISLFCF